MTIVFTSDTHFGHKNIIQFCGRPFKDTEEMDAALIKQWNEAVAPNDDVFHLGDFSFTSVDQTQYILTQLNGFIHIVLGNHDQRIRRNHALQRHFVEITEGIQELKHRRHLLVLCHYPMLSWNRSFHGSIHLHGHAHGTIPFDPQHRRLDVGIDAFGPITIDDVIQKFYGNGN